MARYDELEAYKCVYDTLLDSYRQIKTVLQAGRPEHHRGCDGGDQQELDIGWRAGFLTSLCARWCHNIRHGRIPGSSPSFAETMMNTPHTGT